MATEPTDSSTASPAENTTEVGVYPTEQEAFQHGLVVLAMGRECWIEPCERGHRLLVEPGNIAPVQRQLASFDRESAHWPPLPLHDPTALRRWPVIAPLLWALAIVAAFWGETLHPEWLSVGALDSEAMWSRHEWWRPATALFLHADAGHLVSNGLNGIVVFSAVLATFGRARGWLLLALAAYVGNFASAAMNYGRDYNSIGASTAVFAAVGLLTGRAVRLLARLPRQHRWRAMFVPFAAGLTVLALYGAGGVKVDVMAHATGFIAGLAFGFGGAALPKTRATTAA